MGLFIFTRCVSNTLSFWRNIEDFALFLGVPYSIIFVWIFPEEAPKLSSNFLSLSNSARDAEDFLPPVLIRGICSCRQVVYHLSKFAGVFRATWSESTFQSPGGYLLLPGCLIHLVAIGWRRSGGIILVPWFPSDEGSPKFSLGLLFSCKQYPGKSSPCLLFMLSLDKEDLDNLLPLSPMVLLV